MTLEERYDNYKKQIEQLTAIVEEMREKDYCHKCPMRKLMRKAKHKFEREYIAKELLKYLSDKEK